MRQLRSKAWLATASKALAVMVLLVMTTSVAAMAGENPAVVHLTNEDFRYGTYIIDRPGTYVLDEHISFNPNSVETLNAAIASGHLPAHVAAQVGLSAPIDAFQAGSPLPTQFAYGGLPEGTFTPGGPMEGRYDPAAFGLGFFAAIAITGDDVVLDLNGKTIEQSAEHALLQRFFSVIELAEQPFIPGQGPHDFGTAIDSANEVTIMNGTIGLSAHHGIHGNDNTLVTVRDVNFVDYEVAALALNAVQGLTVRNSTASNRKDVPVLGLFSAGQFIKPYLLELERRGSDTTITVDGSTINVAQAIADLRAAINNTYEDLIVDTAGESGGTIDRTQHPAEYGLFHNKAGLVDGNSYSFAVNNRGVAVGGFPYHPDGVSSIPSHTVQFRNVNVVDQQSAVNEIVALGNNGSPMTDPIGAVFQIHNTHPDSGQPLTISTDDEPRYIGNPVANAQALVAKAEANGHFGDAHLDRRRLSISPTVLAWIEGNGSLSAAHTGYLCNGDSMFHVNKGAIAFKMDGVFNVKMSDTRVQGLSNTGGRASSLCGDYSGGRSHPGATLPGYGGAAARGFTFAGADNVLLADAVVNDVYSSTGSAIAYDLLTDSNQVHIKSSSANGLTAGANVPDTAEPDPTPPRQAIGFYIGAETQKATVVGACATNLTALADTAVYHDLTGVAKVEAC